jgi:GNAT superfamily N-acetyltransferase
MLFNVFLDNHPTPADIQAIRSGLVAYNLPHLHNTIYGDLAVFVRDENSVIRGGVAAEFSWGWLYIDALWMDEAWRGRGYGTALMTAVEQAAVARGIDKAYLATTDFQAPAFYRKLGYEVWATLEDRPPGHRYFYLKKENLVPKAGDQGLVVDDHPREEDLYVLRKGLTDHAVAQAGPTGSRDLGVFIRDEQGAIHGGLYGRTYWGWFDLMFVWVDEPLRGQGYGARLMQQAEQECRRRGIRRMVADTASFQALPFYQQHGFVIFGTLEDRPPGYRSYFIKRDIPLNQINARG